MINLNKIKLIISDLDGTLLNDSKQIDRDIIRILPDLKEWNIQFSLVTGRNLELIEPILDQLQLSTLFVCDNGANLYDQHRNLIQRTYINNQELSFVLSILDSQKITAILFHEQTLYRCNDNNLSQQFLLRFQVCTMNQVITDYQHVPQSNIYKIVVCTENSEHMKKCAEYVNQHTNQTLFIQSEGSYFTITHHQANKGTALQYLLSQLKVKHDEVIVFGDNHNDIPMFDVVEYSVAMDNACLEVKQHCSSHTLTNNENGVSYYLQELINKKISS